MGDMGDTFRAMKDESKKRRSSNRTQSSQMLEDNDTDFISKNGGSHLIVYGRKTTIDFWPGTGRWIPRNTGFAQFGVRKLLKYLGGNDG